MNRHVRIVGILWLLSGIALAAGAVWELIYEHEWPSVVLSWVITLAFGALACVAGVLFGRAGAIGRILIRAVSGLALIYCASWLLLGGVDDAGHYAPGIVAAIVLSVYALVIARREARAA